MARQSKKNIQFETVLVGESLANLLLATILQADRKVALVCVSPQINSPLKLDHIPKTEETLNLISWLENLLDKKIIEEEISAAPLSVQSGQLLDFSGFGDLKFENQKYLDFYNTTSYLKLSLSSAEIMDHLKGLYKGELLSTCELTSIDIEDKEIRSITVNGATTIEANQFIFDEAPARLIKHMSVTDMPSKFMTQSKNTEESFGVQLSFTHTAEVTDNSNLHVLFGSKADFEPCLGRFYSEEVTNEEGETSFEQRSTWVSLVSAELAEAPEHLGSVVKYMKRQIKRAYADWGETKREKITVFSNYSSSLDSNRFELCSKSKLPNMLLSTPILSSFEGFLGHIDSAKLILETLLDAPSVIKSEEAQAES